MSEGAIDIQSFERTPTTDEVVKREVAKVRREIANELFALAAAIEHGHMVEISKGVRVPVRVLRED